MRAETPHLYNTNWPALAGFLLPGGYELGEILEADSGRARFRVRVLGDWSTKAFVDAFSTEHPGRAEQLALWEAARELRHPNVVKPLAAGELEYEGSHLLYIVLPSPDENLAAALTERALDKTEAREILLSVRSGLEYLHSQGWIHGHLSPEHVLAAGNTVQISPEYAGRINTPLPMQIVPAKYVAPESVNGNITPAADIWCLGATLFEALTQKQYAPEKGGQIAALPPPFDRVVERCLDTDPQSRCALAELPSLLHGRGTRVPTAAPTLEPVVSPKKSSEEAAPVLTRVGKREQRDTRGSKLWLYAGIAALFVILLLWAFIPRRRPVPAANQVAPPTPAATQKNPQVTASDTRSQWQTKTLGPPATPARTSPAGETRPEEKPAQKDVSTVNGPVWRVILFTYSREGDAQKKAQSINERHPQLAASVFTPNANAGPYLVTAGGKMTREEAAQLRRRVIGMGLPHDSYIQNYKQ